MRQYTEMREHGIIKRVPVLADDECIYEWGTPSSSTCPYDVYERIMFEPFMMWQKIARPMGSGSGGAIRFGDDMIPSSVWLS